LSVRRIVLLSVLDNHVIPITSEMSSVVISYTEILIDLGQDGLNSFFSIKFWDLTKNKQQNDNKTQNVCYTSSFSDRNFVPIANNLMKTYRQTDRMTVNIKCATTLRMTTDIKYGSLQVNNCSKKTNVRCERRSDTQMTTVGLFV